MSHCVAAQRRRQQYRSLPPSLLIIAIASLLADCGVQAEIAAAAAPGEGARDVGGAAANSLTALPASNRCSARKYLAIANSIDDVEDLKLDVPVNIAFDNHQKKRFLLYLNASTPLTINFSQDVVRKIYFNQTTKLKSDNRSVLLPCALRGQYDIFVQAKQRGSVKIEAHALHALGSWPIELSRAGCSGARNANRTSCVSIRSQNRVRKRQMIVKWDKSKFDFHAVQYCLVVNTRQRQLNFCNAVNDYVTRAARKGAAANCYPGSVMDYIWLRPPERAKKIDPRITNIICTGRRTQQLLKGVAPNHTYYLDVFGVHTQRHNLTFHIASAQVNFNRTHPVALRANALTMKKISGLHGVQVFSFKIPTGSANAAAAAATIFHDYRNALPSTALQLRYLILPCGGSEIDAKILQQRKVIGEVPGIYRPIYIRLPVVQPGERYMVRFRPSNEDELLRANKVGLAVTTGRVFRHLPELPENITVFEVRTHCESTTIAWYSSPENRTMSYCIIVFNLPHRNRSSIDYTNYCMDFGKRVIQHPLFDSMKCNERAKSPPPLETHTIFNLTAGETYLIYVTANLSEGKPLPYQSLRVTMSQQCNNEIFDSREQREDY